MCLTEFVVESCVYYGCVPWEIDRLRRCIKTGFPRMGSVVADAPEIGLRDSARLLNCPDATDDTIGIYAEQMFMNEKTVWILSISRRRMIRRTC